ncbi:type II toxin-antitoxin system death-on-curing family toxin [Stenotrophomonas pavanii]|uniref:type II toxin-antitoxin system death-on-curing family toxin n=1 Tax=Stenotrophomonas pavanii TaxID=487698 RepID=UPI0039C612E6
MAEIVLLDAEAILAIWDDVREAHGVGLASISTERLEGAVGRVMSHLLYSDPEPTVPQLAGLLGYSIAKAHAFGDGNKRTALIAMEVLLLENGWINHRDGVETAKLVEDVVANEITEADFIREIVWDCVFYGDNLVEGEDYILR